MIERSWFVDPALSGGGSLIDGLPPLIDAITWVLGGEPTDVYAQVNRVAHAEAVAVETSAVLITNFADSVSAAIETSWNRPASFPLKSTLSFTIVGDAGALDIEPEAQRLTQFGGSQSFGWKSFGVETDRMVVREFIDAITDEREPAMTDTDALRPALVTEAAYASSRTGQPVLVNIPDSLHEHNRRS
jgi:predicted dehydrogenase